MDFLANRWPVADHHTSTANAPHPNTRTTAQETSLSENTRYSFAAPKASTNNTLDAASSGSGILHE